MTFLYVCTPYTNFRAGREAAYREACRQTALLMRAGLPVFSPIAHSHGVAVCGGIDETSHEFWMQADSPMMQAAGAALVCRMDGWKESRGIAHEIRYFRDALKPVFYMDPDVIPPALLAWRDRKAMRS